MTLDRAVTYSVWVGSLSEVADKNALMAHFRKFGPLHSVKVIRDENGKSKLHGYVNYHNQEVAEVASREMNGFEICGRKIRTRGPTELKPRSPVNGYKNNNTKNNHQQQHHFNGNNTNINNNKNIDSNANISTEGEAPSDTRELIDCSYYLHGDCKRNENGVCPYRHVNKDTNTTVCDKWSRRLCNRRDCKNLHPGSKADNPDQNKQTDPELNRCNSHNLYKCYGQCGDSACMLHFDNQLCFLDHVKQKSDQQQQRTSGPRCLQCNAVFFNEEEREKHHQTNHNSADSFTPASTQSEPIGVFWDIENCQIPRGKSPLAVVNKIRSRFYPGRREVEFMCVCDTQKEKKEILEELNKAQINIIHINANSKNAADDKLKQALRRFALVHKPPATVVVISGDVNFAAELSDLRHRHEFRVILLHNKQASTALVQCANESECFDNFAKDIPDYVPSSQKVDTTNEVVVSNLPIGTSIPKIKGRLNALTSNTGGKVVSLFPNDVKTEYIAIVRFADQGSTQRALQRLQKENIFGNIIDVALKEDRPQSLMDLKTNSGFRNNGNRNGSTNNFVNDINKKGAAALQMSPEHLNNGAGTKEPTTDNIFPNNMTATNGQGGGFKNYTKQNIITNDVVSTTAPVRAWEPMVTNLIQTTIHNSVHNGVDILVTNIEPTVKAKDVRGKLTFIFREHSKVISLDLIGAGKENFHAIVKVPKLLDAQTCVSKLNNQVVFGKRLNVELASARQDAILKMKSDVTKILLDTYCGWLPLTEFMSIYKLQHKKAFHITHLDHMKDLVYIDGKPGFQFVCLLHFPVGLIKIQHDAAFEEEMINILKIHNRKVPFASIPGLYWSYLKKFIPLDDSGEMIVRIAQNKKLCLVGNTPAQQAIFFRKTAENGEVFPIEDLKRDILEILQVSPSFCIQYCKFSSLYNQFFGRHFLNSDYGIKTFNDLFEQLADVIQMVDQNGVSVVTFTTDFRQKLLNDNLFEILDFRDKHKVPVSSLLTAYYIFFGHKLYIRNFGYSTFQQLTASLDDRFKIHGTGDAKVIVLSQEKQKSRVLETFGQEVVSLIKSQPEKTLALHNLSAEYSKFYGRKLKLSELGFSKLTELVDALSDYVEIQGTRDEKVISLCREPTCLKSVWSDVQRVLLSSPMQSLLLLQLADVYKMKLMKPFPLGQGSMKQFLKSIPDDVMKIGQGSSTILIHKTVDICPSSVLVLHIKQLLYRCEHFKASPESLLKKLLLRKICIDIRRVNEEVHAHPQLFQITRDKSIQLTHYSSRNLLLHEIALLLDGEEGKQALFNHLGNMLSKQLHMVFRVSDYGCLKLLMLIESLIKGVFEVLHVGKDHIIRLGPLGKLYLGTMHIVRECRGSLLLCNLAPEYLKKYGMQVKPHDFGFTKIGDLLERFSVLISMYGERNTKTIVLNESILNPQLPAEEREEAKTCTEQETTSNEQCEEEDMQSDRSSDVVIEGEEFAKDMSANTESIEKDLHLNDLLSFTEEADEEDDEEVVGKLTKETLEWWMDPVPDLPQPALQPEPKYCHNPDLDLISFADANTNQMEKPNDLLDTNPLPSNMFNFYTQPQKFQQPQYQENRSNNDLLNSVLSDCFSDIKLQQSFNDLKNQSSFAAADSFLNLASQTLSHDNMMHNGSRNSNSNLNGDALKTASFGGMSANDVYNLQSNHTAEQQVLNMLAQRGALGNIAAMNGDADFLLTASSKNNSNFGNRNKYAPTGPKTITYNQQQLQLQKQLQQQNQHKHNYQQPVHDNNRGELALTQLMRDQIAPQPGLPYGGNRPPGLSYTEKNMLPYADTKHMEPRQPLLPYNGARNPLVSDQRNPLPYADHHAPTSHYMEPSHPPVPTAKNLNSAPETYSCFSALENMKREHRNVANPTTLLDIFSDVGPNLVRSEPVRPKIAANFQKPLV